MDTAHLVQVASQAVVEVLHDQLLAGGDVRTIKETRQRGKNCSSSIRLVHGGRRGPRYAPLSASVYQTAAQAAVEDETGAAGGEVAAASLAQADAGRHGEVGWMRGGCGLVCETMWSSPWGVRQTADEREFL